VNARQKGLSAKGAGTSVKKIEEGGELIPVMHDQETALGRRFFLKLEKKTLPVMLINNFPKRKLDRIFAKVQDEEKTSLYLQV
jgi:hypothetical protein